MIDAGIRYEQIQRALDFNVTSLAGCVVSHGHGDHVKALPALMRAGVDVYGSKETHPAGHHRFHPVEAKVDFTVGDWTVKPFEAVHDCPGTLGFVIAGPKDGRLLYLTDSAFSLYRFEGLTHICVECNYSSELIRQGTAAGTIGRERFARTTHTHMSLERLLGMLGHNDLSQVEEIHLLHLSAENSDEAAFKAAVESATGIPVYIAGALAQEAI